ncbi:thiamine-phosphate kinase [Synechococcus sp. RSCCF101]|uniref:thiamine-phosphate kinase n=1 Tax=Synechococcus sp. RSCCF101 TaxID=2511069 RepID=UPI0012461AB4|nr:thiamine-phosphate kinase [Synechococcus sp. RSCCF101]QEY32562.1 thiamine-phosphate kinase [Synechococcus sp. RSCCF101]
MPETLADLGEAELLHRLARYAPPGQLSDDAAVLHWPAGPDLVVNTDVFVEDIHFSDATMGPQAVGWRVAAANGSDLAAMGCRSCLGLTVGLVAPGWTPWPWVQGVYEGLSQALADFGGVILGGDCSGGDQRVLAVTALGHLSGRQTIRRSDARPGDWLISTGSHGLSRLGLALLRSEMPVGDIPDALRQRAISRHRRPRPRWDAAERLRRSRPSACHWRVGGVDSSDGLLAALEALATSSSCRIRINEAGIPLDPAMSYLPQAREWCLAGGEDFELVLSLEPSWARALLSLSRDDASETGDEDPDCYRHIGWVEAGPAVVTDVQGLPLLEPPKGRSQGFEHFR